MCASARAYSYTCIYMHTTTSFLFKLILLYSSVNGSARVSLLQLPLSSTRHCTILASLIRTPSNTILLELHSQCLLVNHTSTMILVKEKDSAGTEMLQRSLENNETIISSSDEVTTAKSYLFQY